MNAQPTLPQIAARFGCTVEQVRALFRQNAADLLADAVRAERASKRIRNFSAAELYELSAKLALKVAA